MAGPGPHLPLRGESPRELRFAHDPRSGPVVVLLGVLGSLAAWVWLPPGVHRWVFAGLGVTAALVGVGSALWRDELILDLVQRRWRRRRGFLVAPARAAGSLDSVRGVVLTQRVENRGTGSNRHTVVVWRVAIDYAPGERPVVVEATSDEARAYAALERWAERLRVDAVDRSGGDEVRRAWDALETPLMASPDPEGPSVPPEPPPGSGIVADRARGWRRLTLPRRYGPLPLLLSLFGLPFAGLALGGLLTGAGLLPGELRVNGRLVEGVDPELLLASGAFLLAGAALVGGGVVLALAREWVEDGPDVLRFGTTGLGLTWGRVTVRKAEVEEVRLREEVEREAPAGADPPAEPGRRPLVWVRSDDAIARVHAPLDPAARAWLRDTLEAWVRGRG